MTTSLDSAISRIRSEIPKGPVAAIFAEDRVGVASAVDHARKSGFAAILVLGAEPILARTDVPNAAIRVPWDVHPEGSVPEAVNRLIAGLPGRWLHYCYNAEYLFYPFRETRSISDLLAFHTEERREAMLTMVVDLYPENLDESGVGDRLEDAMLDGRGYFALPRYRGKESQPLDRQLDLYGGIRWRFEEHIPPRSRRLDRIGLFRAKPGLLVRPDHTLNDEEMNTVACPWHNNLTAAIASFRASKALRHNPGSRAAIKDFRWSGSVPFDWTSQQLMDLGFMEPGQWF